MTKRQRFLLTSLILSMGFVGIQFLDNRLRYSGIALLSFLTSLLFIWSLREGLGKNATLSVIILPVFFTLGVGLFWFLLPTTIFARLPVVALYGIGIYALSLTMNIFTVSAIRTIALVRAAKGVGFVLTLFTSFLLFDAILSVKVSILLTVAFCFLSSFPLFLQGLWVSKLDRSISLDMVYYSAFFSYFMAIVSLLIFFWPVTIVVGSLFLTVAMYVLLGLGQAKLEERLFKQVIREYLLIGVLVFIAMLIVTNWRV
jgi:hypothetical protein